MPESLPYLTHQMASRHLFSHGQRSQLHLPFAVSTTACLAQFKIPAALKAHTSPLNLAVPSLLTGLFPSLAAVGMSAFVSLAPVRTLSGGVSPLGVRVRGWERPNRTHALTGDGWGWCIERGHCNGIIPQQPLEALWSAAGLFCWWDSKSL